MNNSYLRHFIHKIHALEKSRRLSEGDIYLLEKHIKLLCHFLDVKNVKQAKWQTESLAKLLLEILSK